MAFTNRMRRKLAPLQMLPERWQVWLRSRLIAWFVPYAGRAGMRVEVLTEEEACFVLPNRRKVQNHIHGVHAAATALLGETASGWLLGMNLPDSRLPLLKSMQVDYTQVASGSLTASVTLSDAERSLIQTTEKGEITFDVVITDAAGQQPVVCKMTWAWVPKRPRP